MTSTSMKHPPCSATTLADQEILKAMDTDKSAGQMKGREGEHPDTTAQLLTLTNKMATTMV
jgi:hypothetical protein